MGHHLDTFIWGGFLRSTSHFGLAFGTLRNRGQVSRPGFWGPILGNRFSGFRTRKIGDWLGWRPRRRSFQKDWEAAQLVQICEWEGFQSRIHQPLRFCWILLHISVFRVPSKFQEQEWNPIQHDGKRCRGLNHHEITMRYISQWFIKLPYFFIAQWHFICIDYENI